MARSDTRDPARRRTAHMAASAAERTAAVRAAYLSAPPRLPVPGHTPPGSSRPARTGTSSYSDSPPAAHRRPVVELSGRGAARVAEIAGAVPDPELPMISLAHLGVLRAVDVADDGHITVTLTPTYSGCPAIRVMGDDVTAALAGAGYPNVTVRKVLSHAWSSDDVTESGRTALRDSGIAPPAHRAAEPPPQSIECPHCGSYETEQLSRFGATSCKALFRCRDCREPFEYFKVL